MTARMAPKRLRTVVRSGNLGEEEKENLWRTRCCKESREDARSGRLRGKGVPKGFLKIRGGRGEKGVNKGEKFHPSRKEIQKRHHFGLKRKVSGAS